MSKFSKEHMELAARWAQESRMRYKVGSVIFDGDRILGGGCNRDSLHAEVDACLCADSCIYDHNQGLYMVYVYRCRKDGRPANSKPCPNCQAALKRIGVKEVFYSCSDSPHFRKLVL